MTLQIDRTVFVDEVGVCGMHDGCQRETFSMGVSMLMLQTYSSEPFS